jgi:hypothetical protein
MLCIETDSRPGTGREAHQRGPVAVRQVYHAIKPFPPQLPKKSKLSRRRSFLGNKNLVQVRMMRHYRFSATIQQRGESGFRIGLPERAEDRRGQQHIADVPKFNDQNVRKPHESR